MLYVKTYLEETKNCSYIFQMVGCAWKKIINLWMSKVKYKMAESLILFDKSVHLLNEEQLPHILINI